MQTKYIPFALLLFFVGCSIRTESTVISQKPLKITAIESVRLNRHSYDETLLETKISYSDTGKEISIKASGNPLGHIDLEYNILNGQLVHANNKYYKGDSLKSYRQDSSLLFFDGSKEETAKCFSGENNTFIYKSDELRKTTTLAHEYFTTKSTFMDQVRTRHHEYARYVWELYYYRKRTINKLHTIEPGIFIALPQLKKELEFDDVNEAYVGYYFRPSIFTKLRSSGDPKHRNKWSEVFNDSDTTISYGLGHRFPFARLQNFGKVNHTPPSSFKPRYIYLKNSSEPVGEILDTLSFNYQKNEGNKHIVTVNAGPNVVFQENGAYTLKTYFTINLWGKGVYLGTIELRPIVFNFDIK